jgi:hypothetical protein
VDSHANAFIYGGFSPGGVTVNTIPIADAIGLNNTPVDAPTEDPGGGGDGTGGGGGDGDPLDESDHSEVNSYIVIGAGALIIFIAALIILLSVKK